MCFFKIEVIPRFITRMSSDIASAGVIAAKYVCVLQWLLAWILVKRNVIRRNYIWNMLFACQLCMLMFCVAIFISSCIRASDLQRYVFIVEQVIFVPIDRRSRAYFNELQWFYRKHERPSTNLYRRLSISSKLRCAIITFAYYRFNHCIWLIVIFFAAIQRVFDLKRNFPKRIFYIFLNARILDKKFAAILQKVFN